MSQTPIETDGMIDRRSITPMKFVPIDAQTTLQPTVLAQYGAGLGVFKFADFDPLALVPVLTMQITPAYRIQIQDILVRSNATPAAFPVETITVEKVNALGVARLLCTIALAGALLEMIRYTSSTAGMVLADYTIDPTIGDFIRVTAPIGVTGGATTIIIFSQLQ
jgi:hypothetical protein